MKKLILIFALMFTVAINAQETVKDSTKVDNFQKTDEVLAKVVDKALTLAEKTGEFVIEQAPDLLQQFYAWHIGVSIFWIIFSILLFLAGRYAPYLWLDRTENRWNDTKFFSRWGDFGGQGAWAFFIVTTLFSIITLLSSVYDLLYITIAPKLYLIDYFISLKQ